MRMASERRIADQRHGVDFVSEIRASVPTFPDGNTAEPNRLFSLPALANGKAVNRRHQVLSCALHHSTADTSPRCTF